jgi:putative nucleotidyltransferase with HDIG domain
MISALTAAIDAKDHYTFAHSKNVARYAANLAVAAGLNDEQVRTIYAAGLLHDIGKISIPEDILNKTGKLDRRGVRRDEKPRQQLHRDDPPSAGDGLSGACGPGPSRALGRQGLSPGHRRGGDPRTGPVSLAIADVFDAMTTDRPYRKGLLSGIRAGADRTGGGNAV